MVLKRKGRKKCRSGISKKKEKMAMKHHRKENFKKKKDTRIECSVCMEEIADCSDNVVTCGKVNHPLCGECKMKCKDCPMCRSHSVKPPISQEVLISILSSSCKIQGETPKNMINVEITGTKKAFLIGIYQEIRRDKYNYPIYKQQGGNGYIVRGLGEDCDGWSFTDSPDFDDDDGGWVGMFNVGGLMGNQEWYGWDDHWYLRHHDEVFNVSITRI